MLARYETVRQRAAVEGQLAMPTEFCALQILRACNVAPQHLFTLLQPFNDQLPSTPEQLSTLCRTLRRHGQLSFNCCALTYGLVACEHGVDVLVGQSCEC